MIISISGAIKSGKDTVASIIQELTNINSQTKKAHSVFEIKKFADELKDTICRWINCSRADLEDHEFKNTPLGEEWWVWKVIDNNPECYLERLYPTKEEAEYAISDKGIMWCAYKPEIELIKTTPRLLMQLLGTEAGRNILHPNLWILLLFSKYKPNSNWIITDNRFLNEVQAVKKHQGITIRVERDLKLRHGYDTLEEMQDKDPELYKVVTHPGETELDYYKEFDYIIYNNGSLEELIEQVKQILEKENLL